MNKLHIIGNLTGDPVTKTNANGKTVCGFSVAVNRRKSDEADFFRVDAWGALGENCARYLAKGRKVAVTGSVRLNVYTTRTGETKASMDVFADDVEFLSPKGEGAQEGPRSAPERVPDGFVQVEDEIPF